MEFNFKPKAWLTAFVLFVLFCSGLFLTFDGFIFADAELFPDSNDAGVGNCAPLEDFSFGDTDSEISCYVGASQKNNINIRVRIPKKNGSYTITSINESAFSCDNLNKLSYPVREEIVGIIVPDTIVNIGENAFQLMPKLEWIIINSNDGVQIANNFLGLSETLPPKLAKIYLPQTSKEKKILEGKILPNGIEVLYSEDCYSTRIYQDEDSQGTLSGKNLSLDQITKKGDFILENLGIFQNKVGFEITGEDKDSFSLTVNETPITNERLNLDVDDKQRIVLQMDDTDSDNINNACLKIVNMNYDNSADGNLDVIEEIVLDIQEDFEWPSASENLTYNGISQSLINKDSLKIPGGCKIQFSFDQTDWIDLTEDSLPEKTDAGNYVVYFKLVDTAGKTIDMTSLNVQIAQKPLKIQERADLLLEKVYDGKKNIPLSQDNFILQGIVESDINSVELDLTNVSGTVSTANVTEENNPRQITLSGQFDLTGTRANNYALSEFDFGKKKLKVNITKRPLNVTGDIKLSAKSYDGEKNISFNQDEITINADGICTNDAGKPDNIKFVFENFVVLAENANAGTQVANVVAGQVLLDVAAGDGKNYLLNKTSASEIFNNLTVDIYKRKVKLDGKIKIVDREYDGTTDLSVDSVDVNIVGAEDPELGIVEGDEVELDTSKLQAILNGIDGRVGENKPVKITGRASLTGVSAGNYELSNDFDRDSTVNITPRKLTVVGDLKAKNKIYDGNGNIELTTENLTLDGVINGDNVGLDVGNLVGTTDKNAGTEKVVTISGQPILTNNEAGNYVLEEQDFDNVTVDIYKRKVRLDGKITIGDREYDGTAKNLIIDGTNITIIGSENPELGIVEGDEVKLGILDLEAILNGTNGNVGENKPVKITGRAVLTGVSAENYELSNDFYRESMVNITPKKLTIVGDLTAKNKVYDGNGNIELTTENLTLNGVINGDNVGLDVGNLVGTTDKNAGTEKVVTISGQPILTNNEVGNYILEEQDFNNVTVDIYKRKVKLNGKVKVIDREYDGTAKNLIIDGTNITIIGSENPELGIVEGDEVKLGILDLEAILNGTNGNVGENKPVKITGRAVLTGISAGNYELSGEFDRDSMVNITPKKLAIVGDLTAKNKVYDGNGNIELMTENLTLNGVVDGDNIGLNVGNLVGSTDKNAGTGKTVAITGQPVLTNNEAANYILEERDFSGVTVDIYKRKLKLAGKVKFDNKEYDGKEQVNTQKSGLEIISGENDGIAIVDGDNIEINYENLKGYLDRENENVGDNKAVKIEGNVYLTGDSVANYELDDNFDRNSTVNIIPRKITISGSGTITVVSREYNGLKNVELDTSDLNEKLKVVHVGDSEIGIIKQDDVSLDFSKLVGEMEDKNAGENKIVNISGNIVLVGSYKDNYELVANENDPFNRTATVLITKKGLIIKGDISAINKIYDKNNSIELVKNELLLDGKIDGDDININFDVIKGNVEAPKAESHKKVIISFDGELISGADLINYEFSNPEFDNVFVDITPKEIGLIGDVELEDKKYDGTNDIKFKADSIKLNTEEIYEGDEVELKSKNLSAKSENANVGQKNVTVSGEWFLEGNDAQSYVLKAEDINRILGEKIVNITPLPAEFAWSDKTDFDYDGNIHKVTAIVKNRKSPNDTFDLKYDNNTAGNSGSYVAKVIALGNENYTLENAINATKKWSIRDVFNGGGGGGGSSSGGSSSSSGSNIANNINTNVLSPSIGGMNGFMTSGKTLKDIVVPNTIKQRKYVKGYPDGTFRPNGNMTRAEFAQAVYNLINNNEPVNIDVLDRFNDVDKRAWYAKAMAYLSEKNIIKGYDGKIRPNDFITRGELAQILFSALKSYDNAGTDNYIYGNYDASFVDLDNNYWAAIAIRQLASNGMVNGYENKTFRAKANITRAEVVTMISKVFGRNSDLSVTREYIDVGKNHWAYNYILDASE